MKTIEMPMEEKLWTVRQVATLLKVSTRQVHHLNANALMPAPMRLGSLLRWSKEEIPSWLNAAAPDRETWNQIKAEQKGETKKAAC